MYFTGNERMLIAHDSNRLLVSYLLHYSSARYVTFKELFVCKSNNKTGDFDMNLPDFFLSHTSFSVKAALFVGTPSPKRILNGRMPTAA